jgi:hypothetical protein
VVSLWNGFGRLSSPVRVIPARRPQSGYGALVPTALLVADYVWGLAGLGMLVIIGVVVYSVFELLSNEDNWEERQPKRHDDK